MTPDRSFTLELPKSINRPDQSNIIETTRSIVVIGPNGSGKTRLGVWIELESLQSNLSHRVSAQKSLTIPHSVSPSTLEMAEFALRMGKSDDNSILVNDQMTRKNYRWKNNPATHHLNDFDKLLIYLFTEHYENSVKYLYNSQKTSTRVEPPHTKLDAVKRIWESLLPHRELLIEAGQVKARPRSGGSAYHGAEMSDGERVIFYLIGQCLCAKDNGVIIVDEPELHLHKSLQASLWDAIEAERRDCLFVYITHDVEFAASRVGVPKVCVTSYNGTGWDWYVVPPNESLPEDILLKIVGGRRAVLFIEGDNSSLDIAILSHIYSDFQVIPLSGCQQVIDATRTFSARREFHRLDCFGIVDRDYRTEEEVKGLQTYGVSVLGFAEIENFLVIEDVMRAVAGSLHCTDINETVRNTKNLVLSELRKHSEATISAICTWRLENSFKGFKTKSQGQAAITDAFNELISSIDVDSIYQEAADRVDDILNTNNYEEAIRIYNNKGLVNCFAKSLGLRMDWLKNYIAQLLADSEDGHAKRILSALRPNLPSLGTSPTTM